MVAAQTASEAHAQAVRAPIPPALGGATIESSFRESALAAWSSADNALSISDVCH
jgi:hypothetical protein